MSALCSGLPGKVAWKMQHAASVISARCVAHCSALHLPSHRVPLFLPFPSVASPAAFSISPKAHARGCPCGRAGVLSALLASTSAFPLACGITVPFLSINTAVRKPCSCQLALMVRCLFEEDAPLLGANLHKWQSSRNFAPRLYI